MANAPHIFDATEATFEQDVILASDSQLVVLDFWASWCGPCRTLGPILEGLAASHGGAFRLVKVDVDANPQLAAYFQAQSIPLVVALYQRRMVDSFTGALPKRAIEEWLSGLFGTLGLEASPAAEPEVPADPAAAERFHRDRLAADDGDHTARLALGRLLMAGGNADEAEALLNAIPAAAPEYGAAVATLKLKELLAEIGEAGGEAAVRSRAEAHPDDPDAAYFVALADGAAGHYAQALAVLVGQVGSGGPEVRARAKIKAQVLLSAAGRGDEAVETERRRLARLLF